MSMVLLESLRVPVARTNPNALNLILPLSSRSLPSSLSKSISTELIGPVETLSGLPARLPAMGAAAVLFLTVGALPVALGFACVQYLSFDTELVRSWWEGPWGRFGAESVPLAGARAVVVARPHVHGLAKALGAAIGVRVNGGTPGGPAVTQKATYA